LPRADWAKHMFAVAWKIVLMIAVWLGVFWALAVLHQFDASFGAELPGWVQVPGALAMLIGGVGVLYCGALLARVGIFTRPGADRLLPERFLATGPFRFTRNPMSLAGATLLVGIALWNRSALGLVVAALGLVLMHLFVTRVEEPGLERRFGDSYRAYQRQVPRWLPRSTSFKKGD
jgi:protein-S-isoprenylcysteine O-methyltransferase Ste14